MGWTPPPGGIDRAKVVVRLNHLKEEAPMENVSIIGIDLAKNSFQLHGAQADGSVAFRKKLSRGKLLHFLASQPRCVVAMEACAQLSLLGPGDRKARPRREADPADLREAVRETAQERHDGRGGDL